jgi:hypothetical protein
MACTTHHNACECREAAHAAEIASLKQANADLNAQLFAGNIAYVQACKRLEELNSWQYMETAPQDGTPFLARIEYPMRWLAYKPNSQQFRSGIKGRWQAMNEYGGWDNATEIAAEWTEWTEWPVAPIDRRN